MAMTVKYPIGIQTFSKLREEGFVYVDKTSFLPPLVTSGQFLFLSRPRRFGKSLLLSTLHSYFNGERELFKGLAIDKMDVDWTPRPVIHIDFNPENYTLEEALERILDRILREYEEEYNVLEIESTLSGRFSRLIKNIYEKTGKRVVVLVDEYDKPLLAIEENEDLFQRNQATLKGFFAVLKSMDCYIDFAMLTGVARFNKVSIFSDLNNLRDISLDEEFADICGWTQGELVANFSEGIEHLAAKMGVDNNEALGRMKDFYDGYQFAPGGGRLYNPFSVLNALASGSMKYYWFQTGTPTFLVNRIKSARILLPSLNGCRSTEDRLLSTSLDDPDPIPLLFQTGYLTIREVRGETYFLQFPNKEVEIGFARHLQPLYLPQMSDFNGPFSVWEFQEELLNGAPEKFMERLRSMLKSVPYEQHDEAFYQNLVYLLFTLLGSDSRMEEHTNIGRPDLVVRTSSYLYIFEFKYNGSAQEALAQIHERDYMGRFEVDKRKIYLIGANFSTAARGLENYLIEEYVG